MKVLQNGRFRRYFIGQTASFLGDSLVLLPLSVAALHVGGAAGLGQVLAANRIPVAALVLFGGALGDRWSRRALMVGADMLRCAVQVATGVLLLTGHATLLWLVVLQALAGVGTALFVPSAAGLVPSLVDEGQVREANALLGLAHNTCKVLSISLAGVLVATVGPGVALLVDAGTFAVSTLALAGLTVPAVSRVSARAGLGRDVRDGARLVWSTRWLASLLAYGAGVQAVVIGPHLVAGPILADERWGAAGWAVIGVVQAVGSISGGVLALTWRPARPLTAAVAVSLLMVPYLVALAVGAPLWMVCALAVLVGGQGALWLAVQATEIQRRVPDTARSRVAAWSQMGNLVLLPASLAAAGPIAAHFGGGVVLLAGAVWLVASTVVVLAAGVLDATSAAPEVPRTAEA